MTDARADALTAPTTDPGIVHALVYVGDQIAAMAAGSDRTAARTPDSPEREPVEGQGSTGPNANGHMDPRPRPRLVASEDVLGELTISAEWDEAIWTGPEVLDICDAEAKQIGHGCWRRHWVQLEDRMTTRRYLIVYRPKEDQ